MIYNCSIRNEFNEDKTFFMTAKSHSDLYRRILSTYRIPKDKVEILEEYEETSDYGYRLVKSNISHLTNKDKEFAAKAKELYVR